MTPLCAGLTRRGLDARPFVIALAGGANAGSTAIIGSPQNILIGEVGQLDFWPFLIACAPPALAGPRACSGGLVAVAPTSGGQRQPRRPPYRARTRSAGAGQGVAGRRPPHCFLFATPLPHVEGVLLVSGFLLISRRLATRTMLGLVDWHLLVLFGGLFVVTAALAQTGLPDDALRWLEARPAPRAWRCLRRTRSSARTPSATCRWSCFCSRSRLR